MRTKRTSPHHARGHLANLSKVLYGPSNDEALDIERSQRDYRLALRVTIHMATVNRFLILAPDG